MKINELARLAHVNPETIRKYRDRGLLRPQRDEENGYYDYTGSDLLNLLFIRKLRGANLSLATIESTFESGDAETLLAGYRSTIDALEEQIRQLKRREMMLRLSYRHYARDAEATGEIRLIDAFGVKYDSYFDFSEKQDPVQVQWIKNIDLFTLVVCLERRYFIQEELPARVPLRIGIGTYENVLRAEGYPLPKDVSIFQEGRYASFFLTLEALDSVDAQQLKPIRSFLKENRLRPVSDTTAYLYRVDNRSGVNRFEFCVRLRVLPEQEA